MSRLNRTAIGLLSESLAQDRYISYDKQSRSLTQR